MKKFLLYLFLAYVALSVQAIFFENVKPDLVLILVCFYAVRHGQLKGVAYGALTGLLIDTAGGFILGPHIVSKSLAAFLIRSVRENIFQWCYQMMHSMYHRRHHLIYYQMLDYLIL